MKVNRNKLNYIKQFNKVHNLNVDFISEIYNELTKIEVDDFLKNTFFLKKYMKEFRSIEIPSRQYILISFFNTFLNHKFFKSKFMKTKLNFPVLSCWKDFFVNQQNMKINYVFSNILIFFKILNSYKKFFSEIILFLFNFKKFQISNYNHAINLNKENIPYDFDNNFKQYTFIDWLLENEKKDIVVSPYNSNHKNYKNNKIYFFNRVFFSSSKLSIKFNLICKFTTIFFESLFFLFIGKNIYSLVLPELALFLISKSKTSNEIAKKYYFSQSDYIYRPLWTFPLESKGSEILLYYYAGSFDGYFENNNYPKCQIGTEIMSWPKVLIWSESLRNLKKEEAKYSNFYKSPYIYFKDNRLDFDIPENSVSVFDIMPLSYFAKSIEIPNTNYRSFSNIYKFFNDIFLLSKKYDFKLVYKSHKDIENKKNYLKGHTRWSKRYTNIIKKLQKEIILVKHDVSELKIINSTKFSISFPWTSTSIIANNLNKRSFFYDPTKKLSDNDRGNQGIKLIKGEEELSKIFKEIKSQV